MVVDDSLQAAGRSARARLMKKTFSPLRDFIKYDLSQVYDVSIVEKLNRFFEYRRGETSTLIVRDEVSFSKPASFGTALIVDTYIGSLRNNLSATWQKTGKRRWRIEKGDEAILVEVAAGKNHRLKFDARPLKGFRIPEGYPPVRLGFVLDEPVRSGFIQMTITPAED